MRRLALALTAPLLLLASASLLRAGDTDSDGARMVLAEVLLGDTLLLRGSTSDNGKPHVDHVWEYLRALDLRPTDAFAELRAERTAAGAAEGVSAADGDWTLRRGEEDPWIHLRIAYGGRVEVHWLSFTPAGDGNWRVAAADVERYADMRWIRRREAARLYGDD